MGKKRSSDGKGELKSSRSSSDLCQELGVENVDLQYTSADFQNLTTYSLFIRMVRPQILAANDSKMSSGKLGQVMDSKWREFQAGKVEFEKAEAQGEDEQMEEEPQEEEPEPLEDGEDEQMEEEPQEDSLEEGEEGGSPREQEEKGDSTELDSDATEEGSTEVRGEVRSGSKDDKSRRSSLRITLRPTRKKLVASDSDLSESEEEEKPKRKRGRPRKPASDGSDAEVHSGRRGGRRKAAAVSSDSDDAGRRRKPRQSKAYMVSSESESDSSSGSEPRERRSKKKGKKRKPGKPMKPVIPGERKSDRHRKNVSNTMEDRDFEKMLREDEVRLNEKVKLKQEKNRKKRKEERAKAKLEEVIKKGYWQDEGSGKEGKEGKEGEDKEKGEEQEKDGNKEDNKEDNKEGGESGNESDHYWFCQVCKDGGDLILCDTCPKSFHQDCLKIEVLPDGDWSCPLCTGEGLPEEDSEEDDDHDLFCKVCKDGGAVILCDYCPFVYHMGCLNPTLTEAPEGDWKCPRCEMLEYPLKGKVTEILFWRWTHQPTDKDEIDHSPTKKSGPSLGDLLEEARKTEAEKGDAEDNSKDSKDEGKPKSSKAKPLRELFVKFEFHSHYDCEWIPELALEVQQQMKWYSFQRKFDINEPPALEDGSTFGKIMHKTKSEDDKANLQERFYRYGVKPEWLQVHRIVTHEHTGGSARYLVKWRDLNYSECTWEYPGEIPEGLENWKQHVDAYHKRRKERMKPEKNEKKKKPKMSKLRHKMEKQPEYLGIEGMALHPYQLEGLNWLRFGFSQDTHTILADEMGLGKTIQAISFIYSLWKEGYSPGPFLITAPLSTVANWEREFMLWAPEMYVVTYCGLQDNRAVIREREFCYRDGAFTYLSKPCKMKEGFKPKFDVVLTSYEFPSVDVTTLGSIHWSVLIIDEAHRLKSAQSLFFRTLNKYSLDYRLLLTGTPLQNNLEELFNLLNFLEPTKFTDMEAFLDEFAEISKDEQVGKLHNMLAPHMLRRMKVDVLKDLPSKTELIVRVELSQMQKKFYKMILTKNFEALNARGYKHQTSLINIMMDLRKCCNHPYLFPAAERDAPITHDGRYEGSAMVKAAGKLDLLSKMLKVCKRDGHRVLVFSQMTRVLDILEDFMHYQGFGYERIDGSVMGSVRQASIDRFNSPDCTKFVFLLSTKAGGLGINLATADTVIIYDMDWNPHNDIQAFSRAHRIGQKNKVMIYRFVSKSSVEEKMTEVCKKKMMLSELIIHRGGLGQKAEKTDSISKQEINDILKFGAEELFKDSEGEGNLVYDEAAVENLMDRSQEQEVKLEKEMGLNEYLRSFKVASYQVKEGVDEEEVVEEEEAGPSKVKATEEEEKQPEDVRDYWKRVLGEAYDGHIQVLKAEEEDRLTKMGKGKRIKKKVNYSERELLMKQSIPAAMKQQLILRGEMAKEYDDDMEVKYLSDYVPESDDSPDETDESPEEDEDVTIVSGKGKGKGKAVVVALPPLLAKVNGQIEVLGFTARQRRSFLEAVMRFGLPPDDTHVSQWQTRDLYKKPEKIFRAYISLFMRHLCEPSPEGAETYADGVPKEGLSRQHVMTRIGVVSLIRRKVLQYEAEYCLDSLEEFVQQVEPVGAVVTEKEEGEKEDGEVELTKATEGEKASKEGSKESERPGLKEGESPTQEKADTKDTQDGEKPSEDKEGQTEDGGEKSTQGGSTDKSTPGGSTDKSTPGGSTDKSTPGGSTDKSTPGGSTDKPAGEDTQAMEEDSREGSKSPGTGDGAGDKPEDTTEDQAMEATASSTENQATPGKEEGDKAGDQSTDKESGDQAGVQSSDKVEEGEEKMEVDADEEKGAGDGPGPSPEEGESMPGEGDKPTTEDTQGGEKSSDPKPSKEEEVKEEQGKGEEEEAMDTDQVKGETLPTSEEPAGDQDSKDKKGSDSKDGEGADSKADPETGENSGSTPTDMDTADSKLASETAEKEGGEDTKDSEPRAAPKTEGCEDSKDSKDPSEDSKDSGEGNKDSKDSGETMDVDSEAKSQAKTDSTHKDDDKDKEGNKDGEGAKEKEGDKDKEGEKEKDGDKEPSDPTDKRAKEVAQGGSGGKDLETLLTDKGKKEVVHAADMEKKKLVPSKDTQESLRKKFWIADGGFTELHAIWLYEEQFLKDGREFQTWHRRHDYWLLAGIVTHGYRQWHDLLNDPRFAMLNRAFRTDMERQRKAAFLNRRFQLLEQALVIEEQLRKAMIAVDEDVEDSDEDLLTQLDTFGDKLKQLSVSLSFSKFDFPRQEAPSAALKKAVSEIMTLVGDMRSMTYSQIPPTLSTANPGVVQLMQAKIAREKAEKKAKATVICID